MIAARLADVRGLALATAAVLTVAALFRPTAERTQPRYDATVVVDVTMSMTVRDMQLDGRPATRLDAAKRRLVDFIGRLGCGSRVGLAIFSERKPFLLFEPVETCANFPALEGAVQGLEWRMAWEGDSHIAAGLFRSVELAEALGTNLVFVSDGHEAPPLRPDIPLRFDGEAGRVRGLILGVGGLSPSPIPKYDDRGREIGFLTADDVPHDNRLGLPPTDSSLREGYDARNAPFGGNAAVGQEHLSALREGHLTELAAMTGLAYGRLDETDVMAAFAGAARAEVAARPVDLRPGCALGAFAALLLIHLIVPLAARLRARLRARATPTRRTLP